ncbi:Forkhead-associated (FHA) domain [Arabidopsis thaliana x Arabidopsis arenosa]|uniref:protein-serine/threonine phosphatase n=1 Tax=Arabidopsis thaliana x Arabidopsis arenosa TaxID=1240361 RepID=A0A8T1YZT4_9BRAS|nr:Forkhead-associated (FHA) domain [Arabidopsis thaliana x Arabidopsis arenosa]
MAMVEMVNIIGLFMVLMLLLITLIILFACKPWRYFSRFRSSRFSSTFKVGDLQRPLISDDGNLIQGQTSEVTREYDLEGACYQNDGLLHSSLTEGRFYKQRLPSSSPHFTQGESFVLEVISEPSDNALVGQTLKLPAEKGSLTEVQTYDWQNNRNENLQYDLEKDRLINLSPGLVENQRSWLSLEVIAGPAIGLQHVVNSTSSSKLPVKLGRVSPSDLALKDSEVSGKHAQITWNSTKLKWELVDMGSLNGTLVNSQSVSHPDLGSRKWGNPVELASDDIITLGTTTKVYVRISSQNEFQIPFKIGVASDPMAVRRGGKQLPMEDICHYKWPLPGANKFGLFCVCDGHGGSGAAESAIKIIPEVLGNILSDSLRKEKVLSKRDASDVLRDMFAKTEARLDEHQYEGCTATVLLVWKDNEENFFAQCANLGDSACVIHLDGRCIQMTEDHRVVSLSERKRFQEAGVPLRDGETRIFGINLARMLGDKFPKQQDSRFSAEPYISEPLRIDQPSKDFFAVLASDGLWDVVSPKKAVQLVLQMRDKERGTENSAEKIANGLLNEARAMRTKDNTSIIYLGFDTSL